MNVKAKFLTGLLGRVLVTLPVAGLFASCGLVRDDLPECPVPVVELRFIYEYNMEYANAFHNQVDCLSAYFFDEDGHLVAVERVTDRPTLADETYRMHPQLPAGSYHVVAYGGMECDESSFRQANPLQTGDHYTGLHVQLDPAALTDISRARLHNHFFGTTEFTIDPQSDTYATVEMMRNTNSIQVALQHVDGAPIDCDDFVFEITDDNNDFDCENRLLATGEIAYRPYHTENRATGTVPATRDADGTGAQEWHAALAQFVTSRLVARKQTPALLHVRRAADAETVFRIPLINYMLLFKQDNTGAGLDGMNDQEYLDRENRWHFVFFLDENDRWISTRIIINDWEVRMNEAEF